MTINLTSLPYTYPVDGFTHTLVHRALNGWHNGGIVASGLDALYLIQHARAEHRDSARYADIQLLRQALALLAQSNPESANILQLRFLDNIKAEALANQLNLASSTFYERQKGAIEQLTTILCMMDRQARTERYVALEQKLARRQKLNPVGIDGRVAAISGRLTHDEDISIVSIEGIGGIGKTTIAAEVARHLLWHDLSWQKVAWVTARQVASPLDDGADTLPESALTVEELLEQLYRQLVMDTPLPDSLQGDRLLLTLESYLREHKTLVVIDNLETLVAVEGLLPTLHRLCNPSKFLLTSRQNFYTAGEIYHVQLDELDESAALALVRAEARANNLLEVVNAVDHELRPIYETVGGNPLALRLVVGQLHVFDLTHVLNDLKEARSQSAENLYTFIFRRAWDHLDEVARMLLIAMLLTSDEGDTLDELLTICAEELSGSELRVGLRRLVMLNLVDNRGNLFERRYAIHNLTRSFLHRQVKIWQEVV